VRDDAKKLNRVVSDRFNVRALLTLTNLHITTFHNRLL